MIPREHNPQAVPVDAANASAPRWRALEACVVAATLCAHLPSVRNDFVNWDDNKYVTENTHLREPGGWAAIWGGRHSEQYYPLVFSTFRIEHRLWGDDPRGYHATNVALHVLNAWLAILAARSLGLGPWAASFAGLLFGLHPMNVASVAWVTERKNVLSCCFCLLALLSYRSSAATGRRTLWAAGLAAFLLALLSKTAVVPLPASLWLADVLIDRRSARRSLVRVAPWFAGALAAGLVTMHMEQRATWTPLPWSLRPLVAAGAVWFYTVKLIVPVGLSPVYPKWAVSAGTLWLWAAAIGLSAVACLLWRCRQRVDTRIVWGLASFVVMLAPALGFVSFGYLAHAFVADHLVYHASFAFFCALAVAVDRVLPAGGHARNARTWIAAAGAAAYVGGLAASTVAQQRVWANSISLWTHTLDRNPRFALGHSNLASAYLRAGRLHEAAAQAEEAARLDPTLAAARVNLGIARIRLGDFDGAYEPLRKAAELDPFESKARHNYALVLDRRGDCVAAAREYEAAHRLDPTNVATLLGLARVTGLCPDPAARNTGAGVRWAELAVVQTEFNDLAALEILARCLEADGAYDRAARIARRAVDLARGRGLGDVAAAMEEMARSYDRRRAETQATR